MNQIPSTIRVGCYDDNQSIVDLNWRDPDNSLSQFQGNDLVSFSHEGTESHEWLNINENGLIFALQNLKIQMLEMFQLESQSLIIDLMLQKLPILILI